jgi:site-specific recombinase XerD
MAKVLRIDKRLPQTWEEALEAFLLWKKAQGRRTTTLNDYCYHVQKFLKRFPQAFEAEHARRCVLEYMSEEMKPATFNLRLVYLRAFFDWCVKEGLFPENPLAGLKKRKDEGRVVNHDEETLRRLLALPEKKTFAGLRDYALLLLTLDCGIRPKEAFSLLPQDINLRSLEVYVRAEAAKTKTSRTLPISPATAAAIKELLAARHPAWGSNVPVFCTQDGRPLNKASWGERLKLYSQRLGVKITPYHLRHAFAVQFLRNGGHALALQRVLGHADLTMTKRYVALTQQDLRQQHALASPLNVLLPKRQRVRRVKKDED